VVEVPADGGAQSTVPASGLNGPSGVAVDGAGNVFIADFNNNRVVKVQRSQPPILSFAATPVGSTSSDSPQSVKAQNIGNQTLTVTGLSVGTNFLQVPGTGTPADCSSSSSLAPGETCNLSINFAPQSVGNIISAAIFTDNALNSTAPATQSVTLQGTGQLSDLTITKTHAGTFAQSGSGSYTITVTNVGPGATLGTVTVVDTPATGMTVTVISGTGWTCTLATRTCTRADVLAAGASYPTITVTVTIAGNAPTSLTNSATVSGGGEANTTNDTAADVTTIAPGIVITAVNGAATVSQGNTAGFSFNVTGAAGLALGTISFSCSGLPEGAACLFNPPSVTTLPAQVGLAISTSNLHFSHNRIPGPLGGLTYLFTVMMLPFLGLVPMGAISGRRNRKRVFWLLLIVFALLLLAGCGFHQQSGTHPLVAPGVYSITVNATSSTGGVQAQSVVTLIVQ